MLTLYDYLPSQNAWKVRQLLHHLGTPYRTEMVSIFEGHGQRPDYLAVSPTGTVPAIRLSDGRVLAESSAILMHLARGTPYLPGEPHGQAVVHQWLAFEQERVESTIGSLRYWTLTGKLERRAPDLVAQKRSAALRSLRILDRLLSSRPFVAGSAYTIADIAIFAYGHRAEDAGLPLREHGAVMAWIERVRAQDRFLDATHPYSLDPHSREELP